MPVQLSSAEEHPHPETAVKAWKRQSVMTVAIIGHFFSHPFRMLNLPDWEVKFPDYFIMIQQSIGHVQAFLKIRC